MHNNLDISIDQLSKIEGHARLDIRVRKGKVENAKLKIDENKRFYTQAIKGKPFNAIPQMVSRICGTCSIAHITCSTKAIENALGIVPSEQTTIQRKLAMHGLMIRDHAMHLYLFCLPDIFGADSVIDMDEKHHELIHDAFDVKSIGNDLSKMAAGRAVHPTFYQIGGFSQTLQKEEQEKIVKRLKLAREKILRLIEIFYEYDAAFERKTNFVALVSDDHSYIGGEICSTKGIRVPESRYWDHLNRVVIPYSQATGFEFEGDEYMVGALARLNLGKQNLHKETKKDVSEFLRPFPSNNVFHNNLAQAIEILHSIDSSVEILESKDFNKEALPIVKPKEADGIGVIEAPRGTLYYMVSLDNNGIIKFGNLVIPTAQNQIHIENDIKEFIPSILGKSKEEITADVEKLIRAYDPCMSCASHFLKVKWLQ